MRSQRTLLDDERPLDYFDELRTSSNVFAQTREDSAVIKVSFENDAEQDDEIRLVHMTSLLPLSSKFENDNGGPISFRVFLEASGFLAMRHFNERSTFTAVPTDCNIYFTVDYIDTQFSPLQASGQYHASVTKSIHSLHQPHPVALVGAARSVVSASLSVLAAVYETPQISATSTSATLDNKLASPYFARTVPNNRGDAHAVVLYLYNLGVRDFGVIYVRDNYGTFFHKDLVERARQLGMQVVSAPYENDNRASLEHAVQILKQSQLKYFFGIPNPKTWKSVLRQAHEAEIIGQTGYVWLLSESVLELVNPNFRLNAIAEADLAEAIHGVGVVVIDVAPNQRFDQALREFSTDEEMKEYFISRHVSLLAIEWLYYI